MGSTIVQIDKLSIRIIRESLKSISLEAVAEVSYPINAKEERRVERFLSGGFCDLDPESEQDRLLAIAAVELTELKKHLEKFYIATAPFAQALTFLAQRKHALVIGQEVLIWSRN